MLLILHRSRRSVVLACAHVSGPRAGGVHGGGVLVRADGPRAARQRRGGAHLRPIAIVHAQVTSAYVLFLGIPGHVDLDHVVNRMLLPAAKLLGADKVVDVKVDITPDDGVWTLRKVLGWRSAEASGVAVIVEPESEPAQNAPAASK